MQIINDLENLNITEKTSVALGNFDGIHIGHREIFRAALDESRSSGLRSLCFTFSNHPFNFILRRDESDPDAVKLICTEDQKTALIEEMGFDILVNVPFDEHIMKMRAAAFFEDIVLGKLSAGFVSVGFNYTYGARAEGKPPMLIKECEHAGIGCSVHEAVTVDGTVVSSTLIRGMIKSGDMGSVKKYLGRPLSFTGTVVHGHNLGHQKGFPTANIVPAKELELPPFGVYFTRSVIDGTEYKGVSNIGVRPTVREKDGGVTIETNIFDFEGDLYGREMTVIFDHFSRPEMKFSGRDDLFRQISEDCGNAREFYRGKL